MDYGVPGDPPPDTRENFNFWKMSNSCEFLKYFNMQFNSNETSVRNNKLLAESSGNSFEMWRYFSRFSYFAVENNEIWVKSIDIG